VSTDSTPSNNRPTHGWVSSRPSQSITTSEKRCTNMTDKGSITEWIYEIQTGNSDAAQALWARYFERLVRLARVKLRGTSQQDRPGWPGTNILPGCKSIQNWIPFVPTPGFRNC
jgi:hypothetical protein